MLAYIPSSKEPPPECGPRTENYVHAVRAPCLVDQTDRRGRNTNGVPHREGDERARTPKATMSSRLWPSASRFYRAVLRWVYVPEDFSVEEDAQSAQRTVSFCFLERRAGLFLQPLFFFPLFGDVSAVPVFVRPVLGVKQHTYACQTCLYYRRTGSNKRNIKTFLAVALRTIQACKRVTCSRGAVVALLSVRRTPPTLATRLDRAWDGT